MTGGTDNTATNGNGVLGPQLVECHVCGAVGLPERIEDHDCQSFLDCNQRGR